MSETTTKKEYIEAVGRRKTSTARVRITEGAKNSFTVNDMDANEYFKTDMLRHISTAALTTMKVPAKFKVVAKVNGGGTNSQAEAVRHGLARALIEFDAQLRTPMKKEGYLKRDPRAKERRKFGLKKARKAPQWSKR
jgi:small subunit ribosomal protein S9